MQFMDSVIGKKSRKMRPLRLISKLWSRSRDPKVTVNYG
jgi:hypothetical protein